MLDKKSKAQYRGEIFRHLDGIVTAPTAYCLHEHGVLDYLLQNEKCSIVSLSNHFKANEGYLNVALRVLCSQGWLDQEMDHRSEDVIYSINAKSEHAFELVPYYSDVVELLKFSEHFHPRRFELEPFKKLEKIFNNYRNYYGIDFSTNEEELAIQEQVLKHIEGVITGPTIVLLGKGGMFHQYFMEASFRAEEYHQHPDSFEKILEFFTFLGWFTEKMPGNFQFTDKGLFFAKRAAAYGVTVSYIPTFRKLNDLLFGNPSILWDVPKGSPEMHVDRALNVWGSGGAHATYFKVIDSIIIELFNRPIEEQPHGILDMGCGNGAFIQHLFEIIDQRTLRGKMLDQYPLFLVGADFNETALKITKANLIKADIWAKVVWGDIGQPDVLAHDLNELYGISLNNLLNVRTFLDHNRVWHKPENGKPERKSGSTGAFAYRGVRLPNAMVEDSLLEHLMKWKPYVEKFGLLLIELHTLSPALVAKNIGKTAATAYDATHGFSDQYILEAHIFEQIAVEVGLAPDPTYTASFPSGNLGTVTVHLLKGQS